MWAKIKASIQKRMPASYVNASSSGLIRTTNVFLKNGKKTPQTLINDCHIALCLDPFVYVIWLPAGEAPASLETPQLIFEDERSEKLLGTVSLKCIEQTEFSTLALFFLKVNYVSIDFISAWKLFMNRMVQNRTAKRPLSSFLQKNLILAYSLPRKVILLSVRDERNHFLFPMDFQFYDPASGYQVLGMSSGNLALNALIDTKKIAVIESDREHSELIYSLGRNYRFSVDQDNIPFEVEKSERYGLWVPNLKLNYREFEVLEHKKLGSHYFFCSKWMAEKQRRTYEALYHLHGMVHRHSEKKS